MTNQELIDLLKQYNPVRKLIICVDGELGDVTLEDVSAHTDSDDPQNLFLTLHIGHSCDD